MDHRLQLFLLSVAAAIGTLAAPSCVRAQSQAEAVGGSTTAPQVVESQVERRTVKPPAVPTENFEIGLFVGAIGIEDFGSSLVAGSRMAYHFTEDLFGELTVGSANAGKTSYESVSGVPLLTNKERNFTYYDVAAGWNFLPGEVFFGRKRAMPSAVYATLGVGDTRFAGDDHFTVAVGTGLRLIVNDWLALHIDARDRMFKSDLFGNEKLTHNLEFTLGATAFF